MAKFDDYYDSWLMVLRYGDVFEKTFDESSFYKHFTNGLSNLSNKDNIFVYTTAPPHHRGLVVQKTKS